MQSMASLVLRGKRWHVVFRKDGKQIWRSTGGGDLAQAQAVLAEVKELQAGRIRADRVQDLLTIAGAVDVPTQRVPLDELWALYEKHSTRERAAATWKAKKVKAELFVRWMKERHPEFQCAHEVTARLAAEYLQVLAADGRAGQTRNNAISALRTVWETLKIPFGISVNPWAAVGRVEARHVRREALTLEQVLNLFAAALDFHPAGHPPEFWSAAVALGYHTGLRFGDICTLSWDELDLDSAYLELIPRKTARKSDRPTAHKLPPEVVALIPRRPTKASGEIWPVVARMWRNVDPRLYQAQRNLFTAANIKTFKKVDGRLVKTIGFHSLRHTYITLLDTARVDMDTIRRQAGHTNKLMTTHYSHAARASALAVAGILPMLTPEREGKIKEAAS